MAIEIAVLALAGVVGLARVFRRVDVPAGSAALVYSAGAGPAVRFKSFWARAVLDRWELISLAPVTLSLDLRGKEGVPTRDSIRVDLQLRFQLEIVRDAESILRLAQSVGAQGAADPSTAGKLFAFRFREAVTKTMGGFDFDQLQPDPEAWKQALREEIGSELLGYRLERVDVGSLEHTPLSTLDPKNSIDAVAIRRLTERTAVEQFRVNEARRKSEASG